PVGPGRARATLQRNIGIGGAIATPKSAKSRSRHKRPARRVPREQVPLASRCGGGDDAPERGGRSRALLDPSQEQPPGPVRFSALHALVRYLQPRLSADEGGARLHAAAGPPPDRGLYAGRLAGPLHRREY